MSYTLVHGTIPVCKLHQWLSTEKAKMLAGRPNRSYPLQNGPHACGPFSVTGWLRIKQKCAVSGIGRPVFIGGGSLIRT